jgi:hypothetical protein
MSVWRFLLRRLRCLEGGMFWGTWRISGLGWSAIVSKGNCRSLWIVVFLTYRGASNAILSILFLSISILCMWCRVPYRARILMCKSVVLNVSVSLVHFVINVEVSKIVVEPFVQCFLCLCPRSILCQVLLLNI